MKSHKKKVLHISHTDIRTDSRILKEIKALDAAGQYELYGLGVDSRDLSREASIGGVVINSIPLFFTKFKWRPSIVRYVLAFVELNIKLFFRGLKVAPDIVHCHDTMVLPVGWMISKIGSGKLVYDAHELESEKNSQSKLNSKLTLMQERFIWPSIDLFITVSPSIKTWYDETLGSKNYALVLNSPVYASTKTKEYDQNSENYLRHKFDIPSQAKVFIYVGMLIPGRGIANILEVFKDPAVKSHVVFLGFGVLEKEIKETSLDYSNIHLHEAVPHDKVVSVVKSADVGLCFIEKISLSDFYCLPNKLFEYAFSGLPVLASNFPDMAEVVTNHKLGECADGDVTSILRKVKRMEEGCVPYEPVDLGQLSWSTQERRLVKAYERLCN